MSSHIVDVLWWPRMAEKCQTKHSYYGTYTSTMPTGSRHTLVPAQLFAGHIKLQIGPAQNLNQVLTQWRILRNRKRKTRK